MMAKERSFYLMSTGQIESCNVSGYDQLYAKYSVNFGPDWKCVQGIQTGVSQTSRKNPMQKYPFLWNYPFDLTFKSFNPTLPFSKTSCIIIHITCSMIIFNS